MRGLPVVPWLLLTGCSLVSPVEVDYSLQVLHQRLPIAGAEVECKGVQGLWTQTAVTDENGRCRFEVSHPQGLLSRVNPGFEISIRHPGYLPRTYKIFSENMLRRKETYTRTEAVDLRRYHFIIA